MSSGVAHNRGMQALAQFHRWLAWLTLAGFVVQFYLAGLALFGASTFELHRALGYLLVLPVLLLVVLALVRRQRRLIGLTAGLIVLIVVQVLLPGLRTSVPWLSALHPLNGIALMGLTATIARAAQPQQADARQHGARDVHGVQPVLGSN